MKTFLLIFTVFWSVIYCCCIDHTIDNENDGEFEKFLNESMEKYGEWLRNNSQDPSTPITETLLLTRDWGYVNLTCHVRNQRMVNHSKGENNVVESKCNFQTHTMVVFRDVNTPYQFQGELNCSGLIEAKGFADVEQDIYFVGTGNWTITANHSYEWVDLFNVGLTEQGSLDLTESWIQYIYFANQFGGIEFDGKWMDTEDGTLIRNHVDKVLDVFTDRYSAYLRGAYSEPNDHSPSKRLFFSYVIDEVIKKANISEIIPNDPPPTYSPTPSTTTTRITTTTTPPSTTSTGKYESTTLNSATSVAINSGLVYLSLVTIAYLLKNQ